MSKLEKKSMEKVESYEEYEEDFEDYDFDYVDNIIGTTATSMPSRTPESDSAGNEVNTKSHDLASGDMTSSLESDFEYQEDDSACSQEFNFQLFREALNEVPITKKKRFKNGTRTSLTFSNQRMRDIDRANQVLLDKIMRSGPAGDGISRNNSLSSKNQRPVIRSSAEVNRRKQQSKIDYENQLLQRKLDKISARRPMV